MTPSDIIPVYTKMNENFKGGLNNVMTSCNDPVDSRYHQQCVDNRHWSWIGHGLVMDLSVCQTMNGAALVDDRSGVTFSAELCIPWDAPEAVVDIDSAELISFGSLPDKVWLFSRRKDAAVSRILMGRDSRSVRFLVPDTRRVDRSYHDVTVVDMEDEPEPMVVLEDMT